MPRTKLESDIFIFKEELFGNTIEFTLYYRPVGINRENIIIWEVRDF